ncbi:hypothetical protein, partial [Stenotrophomonas maltophilia]|uniref:hypothetical protein n=1 Tax=Stenotrophomonas maltophilia TaxID=40324 RepID=UPI0013D8F72F
LQALADEIIALRAATPPQLGEKTLIELLDLGWIAEPADIFRLAPHREELLGREGWQEKSVDALLAATEA